MAAIASATAVITSCGGSPEPVTPTPRSEFRSTYPCELLTRSMAERLLAVHGLKRVAAQSFDGGDEQCLWATSKYNWTPGVGLVVHADENPGPSDFARTQRSHARAIARLRRLHPKLARADAYRPLRGLGDRAFLISSGRVSSTVTVQQDARSFTLTMSLKRSPRSQPPPIAALEAMARDISRRFDPPPPRLRGRLSEDR